MSSANPDPVINKSNAIRSLSHSLRVSVPGILINAANGLWWGDTRPAVARRSKTDTLANSTCTTAAAIEPHHTQCRPTTTAVKQWQVLGEQEEEDDRIGLRCPARTGGQLVQQKLFV